MENHILELSKLCRLCCKKIYSSKSYIIPKNVVDKKDEISELFNYDVASDSKYKHPHQICHKCSVKLDWVADNKYEKVEIACFEEHKDGNCRLCRIHRLPEHHYKMIKSLVLDLNNVAVMARDFDFQQVITTSNTTVYLSLQKIVAGTVKTIKSVLINADLSWKFWMYSRQILRSNSPFLSTLPIILTSETVRNFFYQLNNAKLCIGNDDFQDLISYKLEGNTTNTFKKGNIEDSELNGMFITENVVLRSSSCEVSLAASYQPNRCPSCANYRRTLKVMETRIPSIISSAVKKKRPHTSLSKKQLRKKLFTSGKEIKDLHRKQSILENRLQRSVTRKGVTLDEESHGLISKIVEQDKDDFPENSVMGLLWNQQKKASSVTKKTAMRWHPIIIRWCLSIYLRSPGTYDHLRQTGFLQLPHRTTLNQYTNFTEIGTGFNADVIQRLHDDFKLDQAAENQKMCCILFDEMKIKSGLVFSHKTGKLIGFTELGSINDEMNKLENQVKNNELSPPDLASHVLTIMARGVVKHFNYPIGYFATKSADADQLFHIIWEAVGVLEMSGMRVVAFVSDGASQNRRFFAMHKLRDKSNVSPEGVVYWCINRFNITRKIYFFSDVPHLIKTIRNNIEKSATNGTRNLMVKGREICWSHLRYAYESDLNLKSFTPGLRKLNRITFDHIHLTPRLRMRVNLAAQVLSKSMADTLAIQGYEHTKATEEFIRLVDQFFDCLNVSQTFQGQKARKPALYPYKHADDWRFEWLEKTFLKYLNDWEEEVLKKETVPKELRPKQCLSYQTLEGIRITVRSFVELVPQLLSLEGVDYILSDKFNQDPLEEHFGKQRSRGIENPSLEQYMYNERKILVSKSDMIIKGNTRGRKNRTVEIDITDDREMPKRSKKKKTVI